MKFVEHELFGVIKKRTMDEISRGPFGENFKSHAEKYLDIIGEREIPNEATEEDIFQQIRFEHMMSEFMEYDDEWGIAFIEKAMEDEG